MNNQEADIMNILLEEPFVNQRVLAERSGHSLGIVNRALKSLLRDGYLDEENRPTEKARMEKREKAPQNAVILAAGFGLRMVPINRETPKALLEIHGEPLIERIIRQLHEVGITEIYVVVGFLKEAFEYLIDTFGVTLVVNRDYAGRNNLHSLCLVEEHLSNTYVIPGDLWCRTNPFRKQEFDSWYMISEGLDPESEVRVNRKMEVVRQPFSSDGNRMIGISYLLNEDAEKVREELRKRDDDYRFADAFWEETLYEKERMRIRARVVPEEEIVEINTYEQLRELDHHSSQLKTETISLITSVLRAKETEVTDITVLKKGMTNRSFLFTCRGKRYIMRIPGEGTERLINRREEAEVYRMLEGKRICDDVIYLNPENGYKMTVFLENARTCDPKNPGDVKKCMNELRRFHEQKLHVNHTFDLFRQIEFYESLWEGKPSVFRDYQKTKEQVLSLKPYIEAHAEERVLCHIDAVPDNFLFLKKEDGTEEIRLIDWEYAGMQDPHVDIAMFCVYSLYEREQVDSLIDAYFPEGCVPETRIKIYAYLSVCGLLWSNWCEYKRTLGIEFGEYSLRQYRYAKEYYRVVQAELGKKEGD